MTNVLNVEMLKKIANGEVARCQTQRRMARTKLYILEKDGFACRQCKSQKDLSIDHIIPVREIREKAKTDAQRLRWGTYKDHCQVLCWECHKLKNMVDTQAWLQTLSEKQRRKWYEGFVARLMAKKAFWPEQVPVPEYLKEWAEQMGMLKTEVKT